MSRQDDLIIDLEHWLDLDEAEGVNCEAGSLLDPNLVWKGFDPSLDAGEALLIIENIVTIEQLQVIENEAMQA